MAADGIGASGAFSTAGTTCSGIDFGCSSLRRFCIFSMSERFKASNRLRKIEEKVLNLMHWSEWSEHEVP